MEGDRNMPEYINIISQESIDCVPTWIAILGALIGTIIVCSTFIYWFIVKDPNKALKWICYAAPIAIVVTVCWHIITTIFFSVPTGRYRYEATIDKENMTITQYEEFMQEYNHSHCKDGIYYFEDWVD